LAATTDDAAVACIAGKDGRSERNLMTSEGPPPGGSIIIIGSRMTLSPKYA
jgi:hypothetical protein